MTSEITESHVRAQIAVLREKYPNSVEVRKACVMLQRLWDQVEDRLETKP